jgi:hypothetical protein
MTSDIASVSSSVPSEIDQELVLLETLKELLTNAMGVLSGGEAGNLVETSRQISLTATGLMARAGQFAHLPSTPEEEQQRRRLLAELASSALFAGPCYDAGGVRWLLRKRLRALQSEPESYAETMEENLVVI